MKSTTKNLIHLNSNENEQKTKEEIDDFIFNNIEPLKLDDNKKDFNTTKYGKKVSFEELQLQNTSSGFNIKQKNKSSMKSKSEINKEEKKNMLSQSELNRKKFIETRNKEKERENKKKKNRIKIDIRELVSDEENQNNENEKENQIKNKYYSKNLKILKNYMGNSRINTNPK